MTKRITLSERATRRLGVRALEYVHAHSVTCVGGGALLVPDRYETPAGVSRTLTRLYGPPRTSDRGEVAYWEIGGDDVRVGAK